MDLCTIFVANQRSFKPNELKTFFKKYGEVKIEKSFFTFNDPSVVKKIFHTVRKWEYRGKKIFAQVRTGKTSLPHDVLFIECDVSTLTDFEIVKYFYDLNVPISYEKTVNGYVIDYKPKLFVPELLKSRKVNISDVECIIHLSPSQTMVTSYVQSINKKGDVFCVSLMGEEIGKIRGKGGKNLLILERNFSGCKCEMQYYISSVVERDVSRVKCLKSVLHSHLHVKEVDWRAYTKFSLSGHAFKFCLLSVKFSDLSQLYDLLYYVKECRLALLKHVIKNVHYEKIFSFYEITKNNIESSFMLQFNQFKDDVKFGVRKVEKYFELNGIIGGEKDKKIEFEGCKWIVDKREHYTTEYCNFLMDEKDKMIKEFSDFVGKKQSKLKNGELELCVHLGKSLYYGNFLEDDKIDCASFLVREKRKSDLEFTFLRSLSKSKFENIEKKLLESNGKVINESVDNEISFYVIDKKTEKKFKIHYEIVKEKLKFKKIENVKVLLCMNLRYINVLHDVRIILKHREKVEVKSGLKKLLKPLEGRKFSLKTKKRLNNFSSKRYEFLTRLNERKKSMKTIELGEMVFLFKTITQEKRTNDYRVKVSTKKSIKHLESMLFKLFSKGVGV